MWPTGLCLRTHQQGRATALPKSRRSPLGRASPTPGWESWAGSQAAYGTLVALARAPQHPVIAGGWGYREWPRNVCINSLRVRAKSRRPAYPAYPAVNSTEEVCSTYGRTIQGRRQATVGLVSGDGPRWTEESFTARAAAGITRRLASESSSWACSRDAAHTVPPHLARGGVDVQSRLVGKRVPPRREEGLRSRTTRAVEGG